jgi:tetratricopeptide (TPR) repeat protein
MRNHLPHWALLVFLASLATIVACTSTQVSSGILYQREENHVKAVKMFREALWFDENDAAAYFHLGESLCVLAEEHAQFSELDSARIKLHDAHRSFMKAAELEPEKYGVTLDGDEILESNIRSNYARFFNKAVQFNETKMFDDAIHYFELASAIDPRGAAGFSAMKNAIGLRFNLATQENDEAAVAKLLTEVDALVPADGEQKADLVNQKAHMLGFLGRDAEAGVLYEQLLADNPDDSRLQIRVAGIRRDAGDLDGAAELYERVIRRAESDPDATNGEKFNYIFQAISTYSNAERYDEVILKAEQALAYATGPEEEYLIYFNIAYAHFELERWELAIEFAEKAISRADHKPLVWRVYYLALTRAGRSEDGQRARERYELLRSQEG